METQYKNHNMLEKALLILEYIAGQSEGVQFIDVANEFKIPKSSAHILVRTLFNMRYLQRNNRGRFCIGLKAFEIGSRFIDGNDTFAHARQVIKELAADVNETVHLALLDGIYVVYIEKCECSHVIRMVSSIGKRVYAHATALGKALLSGKTDEEIRGLYPDGIPEMTNNTVTDMNAFLKQLEEIRGSRFATEHEESTAGVCCIAVPIVDSTGKIVMGMSISIPLLRFDSNFERFKEPLLRAKKKIEMLTA